MQIGPVSGHAYRTGKVDRAFVAQSLRQQSESGAMNAIENTLAADGGCSYLPGMGLKLDGLSNRDEPCARLLGLLTRYPTAGGAAPDVEERLR